MAALQRFENRGFGWVCRRCDAVPAEPPTERSRLMREGEAEARFSTLASTAMARWANDDRSALECPKCGAFEEICRNEDP
jgi:hypothetical protein